MLTTSSGSAAEEPGETERRLEDGDTARRALDARTRAAELTLSAPSRSAAACSRLARRAANKPFGRAATAAVVCGTASGGSATGATDASCPGSGSGCGAGAGVGGAAPTAELSVPSTDTGAPDAAACRASRSLRERSAIEIRPPTAASAAGSAGSSPAGTASGTEASGAGTAASVSAGCSGVAAWICSSKANCGD